MLQPLTLLANPVEKDTQNAKFLLTEYSVAEQYFLVGMTTASSACIS